MKRLRKAMCWLLCAVMVAGAVACTGEKSASGKISPGIKTQQEKQPLTDGKYREKVSSSPECVPDNVVVENNSMHGCSPVTCKQDLDVIGGGGSSLGGGMIGGGAGIGLATIISEMFGDDSDDVESKPNAGKDLTDAEKAELGGVGAGTGTPPPPENEPNQKNNKPTQKLNQKQESSIRKIDNAIKNALKDHDIAGTIKDMDGNPVPKRNGGSWDHMQEMKNTLSGLRNNANTLKNVNNPEAQAAYARATDAINKIESALKGHGI